MASDFMGGHYTWIFSGIGVAMLTGITGYIFNKRKKRSSVQMNNISQNVNVNLNQKNVENYFKDEKSLEDLKLSTHILFIDDDVKFKIVTILKNAGWINTSIIKDIKSLDNSDVMNTDLFFVDVNGVGKNLGFKDEGLGLAKALKEKYPSKRVVIYSSNKTGDRFHEALRQADDFLSKDAEPYQFQKIVEELVKKDKHGI
jgi:hypothetical protein